MKTFIAFVLVCFTGTAYGVCPGGVCSLNKNKINSFSKSKINQSVPMKFENFSKPVTVYNTFPSNPVIKEYKNLNTVQKGNCRCYRCGCR